MCVCVCVCVCVRACVRACERVCFLYFWPNPSQRTTSMGVSIFALTIIKDLS